VSSTVKLSKELKERFEKLRAQFMIKGKKLKQEELLEILISIGEISPLLLEREVYSPLPVDEQQKILQDKMKLGTSSEEDIDRDLYGE
jgi:hypothetical protein